MQRAEVHFIKNVMHDPYKEYRGTIVYIFENIETKERYRWATKKDYVFREDVVYRFSFILTDKQSVEGIHIKFVKNVEEYGKNSYGDSLWRPMHSYEKNRW